MNPIAPRNLSSIITTMTKADAMAPIVALEGTVVAGRTYQAYKRGKWDEARERFIEESMGSIVWLSGVASLNKLGDKLVGKILKISSLASLIGVLFVGIMSFVLHPEIPHIHTHAPLILIMFIIFYKHIPNIIRLFQRKEQKIL